MKDCQPTMFTGLPDKKLRWRSLVSSCGVHALAIGMLGLLPAALPRVAEQPKKYDVTLVAPAQVPPPSPYRIEAPKLTLPPLPKLQLQQPKLEMPPVADLKRPDLPQPRVELPQQAVALPTPPQPESGLPGPKAEVKMGTFSEGSSAKPTVNAPVRQVQTGGFGDPNGIAAKPVPGKEGNIAHVGAFDLPTGAGVGNGAGGARGTRGVIASAGFGNGIAAGGDGGAGGRGSGPGGRAVQSGGFGDVQRAAPAPAQRPAETKSTDTPLEILSKPKPAYTEEARRARIEGSVALDVIFLATGEIKVLRVVRGLGYGLDENAAQAAQKIRFKPAQRQGTPVDFAARIQVVFQMAY